MAGGPLPYTGGLPGAVPAGESADEDLARGRTEAGIIAAALGSPRDNFHAGRVGHRHRVSHPRARQPIRSSRRRSSPAKATSHERGGAGGGARAPARSAPNDLLTGFLFRDGWKGRKRTPLRARHTRRGSSSASLPFFCRSSRFAWREFSRNNTAPGRPGAARVLFSPGDDEWRRRRPPDGTRTAMTRIQRPQLRRSGQAVLAGRWSACTI